jgi:hypothetical protein
MGWRKLTIPDGDLARTLQRVSAAEQVRRTPTGDHLRRRHLRVAGLTAA